MKGGSYVKDKDGKLKRAAFTQPAALKAPAPARPRPARTDKTPQRAAKKEN